ncbi:MAG: hypothetical protein C0594_05090 [Marinilabiliales bacterium]|nr:MAG: hypothetical protein C0594_05090 [Marinilabiliales bacterium]
MKVRTLLLFSLSFVLTSTISAQNKGERSVNYTKSEVTANKKHTPGGNKGNKGEFKQGKSLSGNHSEPVVTANRTTVSGKKKDRGQLNNYNGFPKYVDTGNPEQDYNNYLQAIQTWKDEHPGASKKLKGKSNTQSNNSNL